MARKITNTSSVSDLILERLEADPGVGRRRLKPHRHGEAPRLVGPQITRPDDIVMYQYALPDIRILSKLELDELLEVCQRYGIVQPWEEWKIDTAKYVQRVANKRLTPGQIAAEVDRLTSLEAKEGALRASRRGYREVGLYESIKGTPGDKVFTRVGENDQNMCDNCARLAGEEGTIEEHYALGMPGNATCDGGDRCRCDLIMMVSE